MNFDQLRYFREIALTKSFTKAADNLFITQAGLTYQIKQLENELGFRLFDRDSHRVELTSQGKALRPTVETMLAMWEEGYAAALSSSEDANLTLRIGMIEFMDERAVLAANAALRKLHPGCEILPRFMRPAMYQERISDLIAGKLDAIFMSDDEVKSASSLDFVPLHVLYHGVYGRADDVVFGKDVLAFEDLAGREVVIPETLRTSGNKRRHEALLRRIADISPAVEIMYVPDYDTMRMMIADTGRVGLIPYSSTSFVEGTPFSVHVLDDGLVPIHMGIAYVRQSGSPLALDYVRLCKESFAATESC